MYEPREPAEYTETQMVLLPVFIEAVCVSIAIGCAVVLVAVLSMPWPI